MNRKDKKMLEEYREQIEGVQCAIGEMKDNEEEKLSNLEERNIYDGEIHDNLESARDALEYVYDNLQEALDNIDEILGA